MCIRDSFNGIVNVLTEQAAKVFRFEEQNQLHEEIIDTGLAQIYQSHLEVGERMATEMDIAVKKTLLDGKPFQKIIDHARRMFSALLPRPVSSFGLCTPIRPTTSSQGFVLRA